MYAKAENRRAVTENEDGNWYEINLKNIYL